MAINLGSIFASVRLNTSGLRSDTSSAKAIIRDTARDFQTSFSKPINPTSIRALQSELQKLKADAAATRAELLKMGQQGGVKSDQYLDLEKVLSQIEAKAGQVSAALQDLRAKGERIKEIGGSITSAGKSLTMGLTVPIIAAATALGVFAEREAKAIEQLQNMAMYTGLTVTQLQELKFVCDRNGLGFEAMANSAVTFQRRLLGLEEGSNLAARALNSLEIDPKEMRDGTEQFRSMSDLFPELISKLQGVENETTRNTLALNLFGRGGKDILPILGMTAASFEETKQKAHEYGLVLSGDALQGMLDFDDAIDDVRGMFRGMFMQLASQILPILQTSLLPIIRDQIIPAFKSFVTHIGSIVKWFGNLSPAGQKVVLVIGGILAGIGPLLVGIGALVFSIGQLSIAWTYLSGISLASMATPLGWFLAITAAVVGLCAAIGYLNRDMATEARLASDVAEKQYTEARSTLELVRRYDELRGMKSRSNDQTKEMNALAAKIAELNPGLVGSINLETGAINLRADATARELGFVKSLYVNKLRLKELEYKETIKAAGGNIPKSLWGADMKQYGKMSAKDYFDAWNKAIEKGPDKRGRIIAPGTYKSLSGQFTGNVSYTVKEAAAEYENVRKKYYAELEATRNLPKVQEQIAAFEKTGKLPAAPTKITVPTVPTVFVPKGGKAPMPVTLPTGAPEVERLNIAASKLEATLGRAIDIKDWKKVNDTLWTLNQILGTKLPVAYEKQHALELQAAKDSEARQTAENNYTKNLDANTERRISNNEKVDKAKGILSKEEADRLKKSEAMNKQAWDAVDKADKEAVAKFRADEDLKLQIARETGDELLAIQMQWQKTYREESEKTGDEENSRKLADMQRTKAIADYEESIRQRAFKALLRTFELEHIGSVEYIRNLKAMQSAYDEYSDQYKAIQSEIDRATDETAKKIVDAAMEAAHGNEMAAAKSLRAWVTAVTLTGAATDEVIAAVQKAIADLEKGNKTAAKSFWEDWHAVIDSIKVNFVDAITAMIEGTGSLRDFWKQVWHEMIRFAVVQLMIMVEKWIAGRKAMSAAGGAGGKKKGLFGTILGVAAPFLGLYGPAAAAASNMISFDNPINDTGAIRSGQDFARLFKQGGATELGGAFPKAPSLSRVSGGNVIQHNETVQVTTKIEKVSGIEDLKRISEQQAWIISKRLSLAPTSR